MLSVLRRLHLRGRSTAGVLVVDLHDLLARRLVARCRLRTGLRVDDFPLASAHGPTVHRPQNSAPDSNLNLAARGGDLNIAGAQAHAVFEPGGDDGAFED